MSRVSDSNKFIYISGGKCASVTINWTLDNILKIKSYDPATMNKQDLKKFGHHMPAKILKTKVSEEQWKYFKFSFTRNPYSWVVSSYFFMVQLRLLKPPKNPTMSLENFQEVVKYYQSPVGRRYDDTVKIRTQYDFISDSNRNLLMDFVGKIENLQADFNHVCEIINVAPVILPTRNKTKLPHTLYDGDYKKHYTTESKRLVEKYWGIDIEKLQYRF